MAIMARIMAAPRKMGSGFALIPITLKPLNSTAIRIPPKNAPMMVPEPPSIAVPPMTAAATE